MTHTLKHFLTAIVLTAGIALTSANGLIYTQANLTGVGTGLKDTIVIKGGAIEATIHAAATGSPYIRAAAAINMILGMLFILMGFFLHALFRSQYERKVHITVAPKKEKPVISRESWFWVEMKV